MALKAVLIDFDGTLAYTNDVILKSFQHTFRTFWGREVDGEKIKADFGEPMRITLTRLFGAEYVDEAIDVYKSFQGDRFMEFVTLFPGMDKLVYDLKKEGFKVAMVTSRMKDSVMDGLRKFGLDEAFDTITTINDITKHKPDPEAILVTLEKLGIGPDEAVMVGDSKFDIYCSKNAGVRSMLVDWSETRDGIEEPIWDFCPKTADEILAWALENRE